MRRWPTRCSGAVPGGKLPFSWPRAVGQIPINYAHTTSYEPDNQARRYRDVEGTPLSPFGVGLGYSRFAYENLVVDRSVLGIDKTLTVSVTVASTGDHDADEVVQLDLHQRHGSASRPVRELRGFRRIHLAVGESQTVDLTVGPDERRYWDAGVREHVPDASTFDLWVGGDSRAELATTFTTTPG